ncbi:hypothetical protein M1D96_06285 [Pseudomonas sp. D1-3]
MPNHITNRIKADPEVIRAMLNETGAIDFGKIVPFSGQWPWDYVNGSAETAAEKVLNTPLNEHALIAILQATNRDNTQVSELTDECFEQFVQMLRNHRASGFLHQMDFARAKWGTKWNAYSQEVDPAAGVAKFETAWSSPLPIFLQLSAAHPDHLIEVQFADEDIGSNCGTVHFKGGAEVFRNTAGNWEDMTEDQRAHWEAFAYEVTGREPYTDDD